MLAGCEHCFNQFIRLAHLQCFGRRVCRLSVCLSRVRCRKLSQIGAKFHHFCKKSGSPSKNRTSDFAPEILNSQKEATNPQIAQNTGRAYCLAPLAMQLVFKTSKRFTSPQGGVRAIVTNRFLCLSVCLHISETIASPNFTIFVQVDCGCGSLLLWRRCDMSSVSGFGDYVTFSHNVPCHASCALLSDSNQILFNDKQQVGPYSPCVTHKFAIYDCLILEEKNALSMYHPLNDDF